MITWLGQEQPNAAEAAGQAAKDEALKAEWPPTRGDARAVGTAAGAAAGTVIGGPVGTLVGGIVGDYLGGAIYDIVDGFFAGEEYVAPQYDYVIARRLRAATSRLAQLRHPEKVDYYPDGKIRANRLTKEDIKVEAQALERWGVPGATLITLHDGAGAYGPERGPWLPYYSQAGLENYLHLLAAGESARASEIVATKALSSSPSSKKSSIAPIVVGTAIVAGIAWFLLAA